MCLPEKEGGLGIKNLRSMNEAMILKQLWEIERGSSLWNKWLKAYWTKGNQWWRSETKGCGSWVLQRLNKCKKMSEICTKREGLQLRWIGKGRGFTVKDSYDTIRDRGTLVPWYSIVWSKLNRPKDKFHAWMIYKERLLTKDKLNIMGIVVDQRCELCKMENENITHLFFSCCVSRDLIQKLTRIFKCEGIPLDLRMIPDWFRKKKKRELKTKVVAMIITIAMYEIWTSRNRVIFRGEDNSPEEMVRRAMGQIRVRMGSAKLQNLNRRDKSWMETLIFV